MEITESGLLEIQRFVAERWREWAVERELPETATGVGMCRFTSFFLEKVLGAQWHVAGGEQRYDWTIRQYTGTGGYFDGKTWHAHYWVSDGTVIVDLAAGQFGADKILVVDASDSRYTANYLTHELKEHRLHVAKRVRNWVTLHKAQFPNSR